LSARQPHPFSKIDWQTRRIEMKDGKLFVAFCADWNTKGCVDCEDSYRCNVHGKDIFYKRKVKVNFS
jgi:hypothetical protein